MMTLYINIIISALTSGVHAKGKSKSTYAISRLEDLNNPDEFWPISSSLHGDTAPVSSITAVLYDAVLTDGESDLDAVEFDGIKSYMKISNTGYLNGENAFCWFFNIYPHSSRTAIVLEYSGIDGSGNGMKLIQQGTQLTAKVYDKLGNLFDEYSRDILTINSWNFVGFSYNKEWGHIDIIKDTSLEYHEMSEKDLLVNALGDVTIGNSIDRSSPFHGKISCIQFFQKAIFKKALENPPTFCTLAQWSSTAFLDWTNTFIPTTTMTTTTVTKRVTTVPTTTTPTTTPSTIVTTTSDSTLSTTTSTSTHSTLSTTSSAITTQSTLSTTTSPTTTHSTLSTTTSRTTTHSTLSTTTSPTTTQSALSTTTSPTTTHSAWTRAQGTNDSTFTITTNIPTSTITKTTITTTTVTTATPTSTISSGTSETTALIAGTVSGTPTESTKTTTGTTSTTSSTTETQTTILPTKLPTTITLISTPAGTVSGTTTQSVSSTTVRGYQTGSLTDACYYFRLMTTGCDLKEEDLIQAEKVSSLTECVQLCTSNNQCVVFVANEDGDCRLSNIASPTLMRTSTTISFRVYIMTRIDKNL